MVRYAFHVEGLSPLNSLPVFRRTLGSFRNRDILRRLIIDADRPTALERAGRGTGIILLGEKDFELAPVWNCSSRRLITFEASEQPESGSSPTVAVPPKSDRLLCCREMTQWTRRDILQRKKTTRRVGNPSIRGTQWP